MTDFGIVVAKRSVSLAKTYVGLGVVIATFGIVIQNLIPNLVQANSSGNPRALPIQIQSVFPLLSLPLIVLSTITVTTPVFLLFVYDKNNGVLEYLLSLGMDQMDVFNAYLKASLLIGSILLLCEIVVDVIIGIFAGVSSTILVTVSVLAPVIGLSIVSFVTIIMMAFSSLQKPRIGANQPLGIGTGVLLAMPSIVIPLVFSSVAIFAELIFSIAIAMLSMGTLFLVSRLIQREKLLP
jgi:hypothetical protein